MNSASAPGRAFLRPGQPMAGARAGPRPGPAFLASRLPRSGPADAPAPEDPRDQQDDDGADDRAQDPRRVQREERHGVEEYQVLQEAPDEGAEDPQAHGPEQAHRVP